MSTWLDGTLIKLQERNARETEPFRQIHANYQQLFHRYIEVENCRAIARHKAIMVEYEFQEALTQKDFKLAVDRFKKSIRSIQQDLLPPELMSYTSQRQLTLSKDLLEKTSLLQKKDEENLKLKELVENQVEELKSTRSELEICKSTLKEKELQLNEMQNMISSMEDLIRDLRSEKHELTERMISEKEKAAIQINELNSMLEGNFVRIISIRSLSILT